MNNYKYYCQKCNYGTDIRYSLIQHNETELHKTGQRRKKPIKKKESFQCADCDFKSTNKNNYLTHKLNKHSNKEERNLLFKFYCETCDFGVFTETSYDKHKNTLRHNNRLNK
jgi:hypothetical protein